MEPVFKIDASKQYTDGREFHIVSDGEFSLYKIVFDHGGVVPDKLIGMYSKAVDAKHAVNMYLTNLSKEQEIQARRKAVKIGKEKHAAKKAAEKKED